MDAKDLMMLHTETTGNARRLMEAKNHDYTNGGEATGGLFANFTLAERLGICKTEQGMMVRLTDKVARLSTLISKQAEVKNESLEDTVIDLINYSVLILAYMQSKSESNQPELF